MKRRPPTLVLLAAGCLAIAATTLVFPSAPDKDPWSWLIWGREIVHLELDTAAGSSWKPLPVMFTTVLSLFGHLAPDLWLVIARAGGLMALVFAYRIAARLAGPVAGLVAALLLAGADWTRYLAAGNIEPLSAALALGAIDRHQAGRRHQALVLGALAALGRIELWPLLLLYAAYVVFRGNGRRAVAIAAVLAVPALWLGGDWIGSGDPFHGSRRAAGFQERALKRPGLARESALSRTVKGANGLLIAPALAAALIGFAVAVARREQAVLALAGAALALFALVAVMSLDGYGGSPRFLFPAACVVCVLAGAGVAWVLRAAPGRLLTAALVIGLVAATVPFAVDRVRLDHRTLHAARRRAELQDGLARIVHRIGTARVLAAGRPTAPGGVLDELAWRLHLGLRDVGYHHPPAVIFLGPRTSLAGRPPRVPHRGMRVAPLAAVGGWRAVTVAAAHRG